jgi:predicted PurR-regulated permease PerM
VIEGVLGLLSGVTAVLLQVINAVIIPFLVFYLLKDFPQIGERFYRFFSRARQARARDLVGRIVVVLGRYIRGAVSATVLWMIGVRYALVLGLMTSVLNFIPYVGLMISLVVASLVALVSGDPVVSKVIGVVVLYLGQKLLEATVLSPKIIGPQVGLHPVVLILSLMVFGYFLGFIGLLIAVPATALLLMVWEGWEAKRDREA